MVAVKLIICFGVIYTTWSLLLVSAGSSTTEASTVRNETTQDNRTDQVLRELAAHLATVNSVTELYNMMVRYNHQYCTAELLRDLEKHSRSKADKAALAEMKKYCEGIESQHQLQSRALEDGRTSSNAGVVAHSNKQLRNIFKRLNENRTKCRVKKEVIELPSPPPGSIYYPRCTTVKRCSGCCKNPLQSCLPVPGKTRKVKRKVLMLQKQPSSQSAIFIKELRIDQHTSCQCACLMLNGSSCGPLQEFSENNCSCKCRNDEARKYCFYPRSWDSIECRCQCPPSLGCTSGRVYDEQNCKCIPLSAIQRSDARDRDFNQIVR